MKIILKCYVKTQACFYAFFLFFGTQKIIFKNNYQI